MRSLTKVTAPSIERSRWIVAILVKPFTTQSQWLATMTRTLAEISEAQLPELYERINKMRIIDVAREQRFTANAVSQNLENDWFDILYCLEQVELPNRKDECRDLRHVCTNWVETVLLTLLALLRESQKPIDPSGIGHQLDLYLTKSGWDRWMSRSSSHGLQQPDMLHIRRMRIAGELTLKSRVCFPNENDPTCNTLSRWDCWLPRIVAGTKLYEFLELNPVMKRLDAMWEPCKDEEGEFKETTIFVSSICQLIT